MLGLLTPTDPRWTDAAGANLDELLSDHAHCELKAAHSALALVAKYGGEQPALVEPLSALAMEETEHFQEVHARLRDRGQRFARPRQDGYVKALWHGSKHDRDPRAVLLDKLLVSALIEARSCERFRLLADRLPDPDLSDFYRALMASEARHYRLFCGLAEELFGGRRARARLAALAEREAEVSDRLPLGPRVHG